MEFHWGKNPDYHLYIGHTFDRKNGNIAFPFCISWVCEPFFTKTKYFVISMEILCFKIYFAVWRWKND